MNLNQIQEAFEAMDYGEVMLFNNLGEAWLAPMQETEGMYGGSVSQLAETVNSASLEDKEALCVAIQQNTEKTKRFGYKPCEVR